MMPNYYHLLNISPQASPQEIKEAFKKLLFDQKKHPDLGGDHTMALIINEAFETLMDSHKRLKYNDFLESEAKKNQKHPRIIPPRGPLENYRKVICLECGTLHILGIPRGAIKLPDLIPCALCKKAMHPNRYESRQFHRHVVNQKVELWIPETKETIVATIKDFSLSGARLMIPKLLAPTQNIHLTDHRFKAQGEPVWTQNKNTESPCFETGIRFDKLESDGNPLVVSVRV